MSASPAIVHDARAQWLMRRRSMVTASDAAAVIGEDERRGPLAVWAEKIGEIEARETVAMRRGRRFERAIGDEYFDQTERPVGASPEHEIRTHPTIPWLGATLDAITSPSARMPAPLADWPQLRTVPLQIKMAIGSAAEWRDEPPLGYVVQCQVEAACADVSWSALAGLVGPGPLAVYDLPRDDNFLAALVPKLEEFLWHVKRRIPPPADGKPGTSAAVRRLWANEDGETVALDKADLELANRLDLLGVRRRELATEEDAVENALRARLRTASFGALPDGSFLTLRLTKRDGYTVGPTSYRALRRRFPKIRRTTGGRQ